LGCRFSFEPQHLKDYSCSVKIVRRRICLTGNASEFLDPVFSSGMAFATESECCCKISLKTTERRKNRLAKEFADYILYGVDVFTTYVKEWYTGNLQELFFHQPENPDVKRKICAVLAGYVWNKTILL
jgi:flavin-dependent dehydrogenase